MTTNEILNLDCTKSKNKEIVNRFLYTIRPIAKRSRKCGIVPLNILEEVFNGLCIHYGYGTQGIKPYYEEDRFIYYVSSIICRKEEESEIVTTHWAGNAYGKDMWEVFAKMIIKIYADIKSKQE